MGYLHIKNLYRDNRIFQFKECYVLEKIHGTSAHIRWKPSENSAFPVNFFSGGENHVKFTALFDEEDLIERFENLDTDCASIVVYGEAYGGKQQGMKETYGDKLRFIVFDVKVNNLWLDVPGAEELTLKLGLEFVHYVQCDTSVDRLNTERDRSSVIAMKNGMGFNKMREGIVIRPLTEMKDYRGDRIITKHKRIEFSETKSPRKISMDPLALERIRNAARVTEEWVTEIRLDHILDHLQLSSMPLKLEDTKKVITTMIEDVLREGKDEIDLEDNNDRVIKKAIGKTTAHMFKKRVTAITI